MCKPIEWTGIGMLIMMKRRIRLQACVLPAASFPVGVQYYFQKSKAKVQKGKEVTELT
jgi:hypothetical protein